VGSSDSTWSPSGRRRFRWRESACVDLDSQRLPVTWGSTDRCGFWLGSTKKLRFRLLCAVPFRVYVLLWLQVADGGLNPPKVIPYPGHLKVDLVWARVSPSSGWPQRIRGGLTLRLHSQSINVSLPCSFRFVWARWHQLLNKFRPGHLFDSQLIVSDHSRSFSVVSQAFTEPIQGWKSCRGYISGAPAMLTIFEGFHWLWTPIH